MKLAIVEENSTINKDQYKTLKQYSGSRHLVVNQKYKPTFNVLNNLNIVLISNEEIPLYVESSEAPTDELNIQFFVFKFQELRTKPDPGFQQKLKKRLGHYIQTELRRVFGSLDLSQGRYGIPVPITPWEEQLFENNTTTLEDLAEEVLNDIENHFRRMHTEHRQDIFSKFSNTGIELLRQGFLTVKAIKACPLGNYSSQSVVKQLKRKGVIKGKCRKKSSGGAEYRGYYIDTWETMEDLNQGFGEIEDDNDSIFDD